MTEISASAARFRRKKQADDFGRRLRAGHFGQTELPCRIVIAR